MRHISKKPVPQALIKWRNDNRLVPENLTYGGGGFPQDDVVAALVKEQKGLCAYTMLRIDETKCHVEHVKPQNECRKTDEQRAQTGQGPLREDIDWSNLVACHPSPSDARALYGAHVKDGWWVPGQFVSPLQASCETRLRFQMDGEVKGADGAAEATVKLLNLNEDTLQDKRRMAIRGAGLDPTSSKRCSLVSARRLVRNLRSYTAEELPEFIVAIRHAAEDYVRWCERRASKRRFAAASK